MGCTYIQGTFILVFGKYKFTAWALGTKPLSTNSAGGLIVHYLLCSGKVYHIDMLILNMNKAFAIVS